MVARIFPAAPYRRALYYNKQKAARGAAECLHAENFLGPHHMLQTADKLLFLEKLSSLNSASLKNGMHLSLNFPPGSEMAPDRLIQGGRRFMELLGMGEQPYLIYRHLDAGHPHLHIVSTLIRTDGTRINLFSPGHKTIRQAALDTAGSLGFAPTARLNKEKVQPDRISRAVYGRDETLKTMDRIISQLLKHYRFHSLDQFNALLRAYHLRADPGKPGSRTQLHGGLNYFILDENGKRKSMPVKASMLPCKPTLARLNVLMEGYHQSLKPDKLRIRAVVDWTMAGKPSDLEAFRVALRNQQVGAQVVTDARGGLEDLVFIDFRNKTVCNARFLYDSPERVSSGQRPAMVSPLLLPLHVSAEHKDPDSAYPASREELACMAGLRQSEKRLSVSRGLSL